MTLGLAVKMQSETVQPHPYRVKQLIIVALTGVFSFLLTLRNGYLWDDNIFLKGNKVLESFDILAILTSPATGIEYQPVRDLSVALDYLLWGTNYTGYHLTSLLIHIAASIALYLLAEELVSSTSESDPQYLPLIASLLFAAHPIQTQAVSWIMARNAPLAALFCFLTVFLYLKYLRTGSRLLYILSIVTAILAFLSKATAIILPLLVCLAVIYRFDRRKTAGHLADITPFILLGTAFFFIYRYIASKVSFIGMLPEGGIIAKISTAVQIPWFYLWKFIVPYAYSPEYGFEFTKSPTSPAVIASAAGYIAVAALLYRHGKKSPLIIFGLGWYIVSLFPVLNFFATNPVVADRYSYLPLAGLTIAVGSAAMPVYARFGSKYCMIILVALTALLITLSARESMVWESDKTLWEHAIKVKPTAYAYVNLGDYHYWRGEYETAFANFNKAREVSPVNTKIFLYKGYHFYKQKDYTGAIREFSQLLAAGDSIKGRYFLGMAYMNSGDRLMAVTVFRQVLLSKDLDPQAYYQRSAKENLRKLGAANEAR